MAEEKKLYEFTEAGFFAGDFYKVGDTVRLFAKQAQHELHRMKPVTADPVPVENSKPARRSRARA